MNTYIFEEYDNDILKIFIRLNFSKYKNINFFNKLLEETEEFYGKTFSIVKSLEKNKISTLHCDEEILNIRINPDIINCVKDFSLYYDIKYIPKEIFQKGFFSIVLTSKMDRSGDVSYDEELIIDYNGFNLSKVCSIFSIISDIISSDKSSDNKIEYMKMLIPYDIDLNYSETAIATISQNTNFLPGFGKEYLEAKERFEKIAKKQLESL